MRLSNQIVLASTNRDKFDEFNALFSAYPDVRILRADEILSNADKLKYSEVHNTYLENAVAKARLANQGCHFPVIADDSGLEVEGLDWKPGVRSARFASPRPGMTQDEANIQKLLSELKPEKSHSARFVCALALIVEGILLTATGTLEGTIVESRRGSHGFGYDPLFVPKGSPKTLAEMTETQKNTISHRARALHELMTQVKNAGIVFAKP